MTKIPQLLIAAGESKRMGESKQLLKWKNHTLIEHQIKNLLDTNQDVWVILGAHSELIIPVINNYPINIILYKNWEMGMGATIAHGIKKMIKKSPKINGVLISLVDMPLISTLHLNKLIKVFLKCKNKIVVSKSKEEYLSAPILFPSIYFNDLEQLKGDKGAKKIIKKNSNNLEIVNGYDLLIDIDTKKEYFYLLNKITHQ